MGIAAQSPTTEGGLSHEGRLFCWGMLQDMTRRFSIHKGRNMFFVTDCTWGRKTLQLGSPHYKSWVDVEEYLMKLGATKEALSVCRLQLEETGDTTLPIETL
jgi:hypothetical protein